MCEPDVSDLLAIRDLLFFVIAANQALFVFAILLKHTSLCRERLAPLAFATTKVTLTRTTCCKMCSGLCQVSLFLAVIKILLVKLSVLSTTTSADCC